MSKRGKRRGTRQEIIDTTNRAERSYTAPPRDTMRVARANRVLAETLPDVVVSQTAKPARRRVVQQEAARNAPLTNTVARASQKPERREQPNLRLEKPSECRARPKDTRGNGRSRKFAGRYCS